MPSVGPMNAGLKNSSANPYFLVVSTIGPASFFNYTAPAGSAGSVQTTTANNITAYLFANDSNPTASSAGFSSTLLTTGNMLRDMGKSVVASGSTFRKVQMLYSSMNVVSGTNTTGITGVQGQRTGYLTGYILLGSDAGQTSPDNSAAKVVRLY